MLVCCDFLFYDFIDVFYIDALWNLRYLFERNNSYFVKKNKNMFLIKIFYFIFVELKKSISFWIKKSLLQELIQIKIKLTKIKKSKQNSALQVKSLSVKKSVLKSSNNFQIQILKMSLSNKSKAMLKYASATNENPSNLILIRKNSQI